MATLKDISKATGYSLVSIHRALYHKEGLSDETRQKILDTVKAMGYEVNYMASSLKRKPLHVVFVGKKPRKPFDYHDMLSQGVRDAFHQNQGLNIELKEYYFFGASPVEQEEMQCQILDTLYGLPNLDGVVIMPASTDIKLQFAVQKLISRKIPVVFADDSFEQMDYFCAVQPFNDRIGQTGAEFMSMICPPGKILVALGSPNSKGQSQNFQGFETYLNCDNEEQLVRNLASKIDGQVVGLYTVRESNTPALCKAARLSGRTDLRVIGCDLSKENQAFLEKGILTAILDMDSYRQGYLAMHALQDYLLKGTTPSHKLMTVPVRLVIRSNLDYYKAELPNS